jgi:hypothetical protein
MAVILVQRDGEIKVTLPRGAYSKIARRMRPKVSPQMVRLVALGLAKSARVSAAIERYVERMGSAA